MTLKCYPEILDATAGRGGALPTGLKSASPVMRQATSSYCLQRGRGRSRAYMNRRVLKATLTLSKAGYCRYDRLQQGYFTASGYPIAVAR
jgi:hypothetical protein